MNTKLHLDAMKIAAQQMGVSNNDFAKMLTIRMLGDNTVPEELKTALRNIAQEGKNNERAIPSDGKTP